MSGELKACPFCREQHVTVLQAETSFFCMCQRCETRGDYHDTQAEAIAAWNRRVVTREQVEKMARKMVHPVAWLTMNKKAKDHFRGSAVILLAEAGFEVANG